MISSTARRSGSVAAAVMLLTSMAVAETVPDYESSTRAATMGAEEGFIGVILPREAIEVRSRLELVVQSVGVAVGDPVACGDLIAELDTQSIGEALKVERAASDIAETRIAVAKRRIAAAEELRKTVRGLADAEHASKAEVREAELQLEVAKGECAVAEATLKQVQARISQLDYELDSGQIQAPLDGVVAMRYCNPGDLVGPGTPIVRLISHDALVRFAVDPETAGRLQAGIIVDVVADVHGPPTAVRIERVAPEVDVASGLVIVEAGFVEPPAGQLSGQGQMRPGMVVHVFLRSGTIAQPLPSGHCPLRSRAACDSYSRSRK